MHQMPKATIPMAASEQGIRMGRMGVLCFGGTISVGMGAGVEGLDAGAEEGKKVDGAGRVGFGVGVVRDFDVEVDEEDGVLVGEAGAEAGVLADVLLGPSGGSGTPGIQHIPPGAMVLWQSS